MMTALSMILVFVWAPVCAWAYTSIFASRSWCPTFLSAWTMGSTGGTVASCLHTDWSMATAGAASCAVSILIRWWRRKGRGKRAAKLLGAKSRALRDAIAAKARDAARGARPRLRPVPNPA